MANQWWKPKMHHKVLSGLCKGMKAHYFIKKAVLYLKKKKNVFLFMHVSDWTFLYSSQLTFMKFGKENTPFYALSKYQKNVIPLAEQIQRFPTVRSSLMATMQLKSFFPSLCSSLALVVMISLVITIQKVLYQSARFHVYFRTHLGEPLKGDISLSLSLSLSLTHAHSNLAWYFTDIMLIWHSTQC